MNYCPRCAAILTKTIIDGAERFLCTCGDCHFVHWNNPVPVVVALVHYNGNYVIARNAQWPDNIYSLITGYLEAGETPEQAVLREVNEELGLSGKIKQFLGHHIFVEKNQLLIAYEIAAQGRLTSNHELVEIKHLSPSELSRYDFGSLYVTKNIIAQWKRSTTGAEAR